MLTRVAVLAVVPRVVRVLSKVWQAEAQVPAPVTADQRVEEPIPVVTGPVRVRKAPTRRWQIFRSVKRNIPWLCAWWTPKSGRAPPSHFGGSRSWAYLHTRSFPVNASAPNGLGPGSEPGPDFDPNTDWAGASSQLIFGDDQTRDEFLEFTAWSVATELGLNFLARAAGGFRTTRCGSPTKDPFNAARRGDSVHYDELNGRPGTQSGPTAIQSKYPDTEFQFARQGEKGVDVRVTGGKMPWDYKGSNWPKGVRTADIKPGNANGFQTFMKEMRNGKIPAGSIPLPYNTDTLKVHVP